MFTTRKKTPALSWVNCLSGEKGSTADLPSSLPGDAPHPALNLVPAGELVALEPSGEAVALVNGSPLSQRLAVTEPTTVQLPSALLVVAPRAQEDFGEDSALILQDQLVVSRQIPLTGAVQGGLVGFGLHGGSYTLRENRPESTYNHGDISLQLPLANQPL